MFQDLKIRFFEEGYFITPFPSKIVSEMQNYVEYNIRDIWKDYFRCDCNLEEAIELIPNSEWSEKMGRFTRMFPVRIAGQLQDWTETFVRNVFGVKRTAVGVVYKQEAKLNQALREESKAIYYRFVRPGRLDVGRAHRECDFWMVEYSDGYDPKIPFDFDYHQDCVKFWIPISGCTSETSIQIIPKSHKMEIPTAVVMTEYGRRQSITDDWVKEHEQDFISPIEEGSCLVFHMGLVHRGPVNRNNRIRISAEITIAVQ